MSNRLPRPTFAPKLPALRTDHQRSRIRKRAFRPRLEALEGRCLPSITLNNGNLFVNCDTPTEQEGGNDVSLTVDSNGFIAAAIIRPTGTLEAGSFDPSTVSKIYINGCAAGEDVFQIEKTLATAPVYINSPQNSGGPNDEVNICTNGVDGGSQDLAQIRGPVAVSDPNGSTSVGVNDLHGGPGTLYLSSVIDGPQVGQIYGLAGAPIFYDYAETSFVVVQTPADVVVNVEGTGTTTDIENAATVVNVGVQGSVQDIRGTLNIENSSLYFTSLLVDDSADTGSRSVTLGRLVNPPPNLPDPDAYPWGYIHGLAPADINYKYIDIQSLTLNTGTGSNVLNVQATESDTILPSGIVASIDTTLNLGDGTNLVNVTPYDSTSPTGFQAQNLDFIGGKLTVNGGTGSNTLVLDDVANTNQSTWTLTGDTVSRTYVPQNGGDLGPPVTRTVNYSTIGTIRIEASSGGNEFDLDPLQENLADLPASLDLQAAGGSTTLNLFDQNDRTPLDWTVTGSEIDRFTQGGVTGLLGSVTFSPLSSLTIYGGTGPSEFDLSPVNQNLDELPHTTITPLGTDQGSVAVHGGGGDTLILDDQNNAQASAWTITDTTVTRAYTLVDGLFLQTVISTISYTGLADLTVNGGYGGNLVGIHDTAMGTNTTVNSGNGVDHVSVFATTGPLTINTQQGGTAPGFQGFESVAVGGPIGYPGTLDTIQGTLTINTVGRPAVDYASVEFVDMATTTPETYTVTSDTILRSGAAPIHYRVTNELAFLLGSGGNLVNVQSTFPGLPDVFVGGLGNDTFNVGDSANTLNGIQSHLSFQIANAGSQVVLHDEGNSSPVNYTFSYDPGISSSHWVQRSDSGYYILYSGLLQNLVLNTGSGSHIVNVKNTPAPTTVTIHSSGQDTVNIGNGTDGVGDIRGPVNVTNNSAAGDYTALTIDDSAYNRGYWWETLTSASLTTTARTDGGTQVQVAPITFRASDLRSLNILLGNSPGPYANIATVADTPANNASGLVTTITTGTPSAGPGSDQVFVGATTGPLTVNLRGGYGQEGVSVGAFTRTLDPIRGAVTVNSPSGFGTNLAVWDNASTVGHHYTVTNHTVTGRSGLPVVTYTLNNELLLFAGAAVNTIDVNSTSVATAIVAGISGQDVIRVGDGANTLNGISGGYLAVQIVNPGNQIVLNDQGDPNVRNYNFEFLSVNLSSIIRTDAAGNGLTEMFFTGPLATLTLNGSSGTGNDTFNLSVLFPNVAQVVINGDSRVDTLRGPDVNSVWQISGAGAGVLDTQVHFAGIQNLVGGQASDGFAFRSGSSIAGTIDGGAGTNTLDYSRYTGNVMVDLPLGLASLVNRMAPSSISNIQNVTGSQGNDLLVGDANVNALVGGTGRNVLIGGNGADTLDAHVSHDDNILIGGHTDWDMNLAALQAVMTEWDRTDLNFGDRRSDLLNGTNGQGAVPLNMVNGQLILLSPATNPTSSNGTVHADGIKDTLIGTNAINPTTGRRAHNWFFYETLDVLMNFLSGSDRKDRVT